ncbi:MAG: hypothetical protein FWC73_04615 [Defluviitaleaceae bacterium]|nr:hypothetical protein [Defluviitaleaceae bacterium]
MIFRHSSVQGCAGNIQAKTDPKTGERKWETEVLYGNMESVAVNPMSNSFYRIAQPPQWCANSVLMIPTKAITSVH